MLDGTSSMYGFLDDLAVWYWTLPAANVEWLDGGNSAVFTFPVVATPGVGKSNVSKWSEQRQLSCFFYTGPPTGYSDLSSTDDTIDTDTSDAVDGGTWIFCLLFVVP